MHVLVACEASGTVCKAFRDMGHLAWSVDTQATYGPLPQFHIQDDVLKHLAIAPDGHKWDLCIAFPPCTYLTVAGNKWTYHPEDKHLPSAARRPHPKFPHRAQHRQSAVAFVKQIWAADIPKMCIENPGRNRLSSLWQKPNQQIHPYYFGTKVKKLTGLWKRGLPDLDHGDNWVRPELYKYKNGRKCDSLWYYKTLSLPPAERKRVRSKTFNAIALAMASQWGQQHKDTCPPAQTTQANAMAAPVL